MSANCVAHRSDRVPVCIQNWDMNLEKLGRGTFPYTVWDELKLITEPHRWFAENDSTSSPWGQAIVAPCVMHATPRLATAFTSKGGRPAWRM